MDDEIDIEEHDLLEDPRLRNIFPDLSQIKIEAPDDYEDQSMDFRSHSDQEENLHQESFEEYARYGNKIILGSKPPSATKVSERVETIDSVAVLGAENVEIKQEVEDYHEKTDQRQEINKPSSVIIIGSKPCASGVIESYTQKESLIQAQIVSNKTVDNKTTSDVLVIDGKPSSSGIIHSFQKSLEQTQPEELTDINHESDEADDDNEYVIKDSVVLLKDWGPKLKRSPCFCQKCDILFATPNTLLAHNTTVHSLLVVAERNIAVKSTTKNGGINNIMLSDEKLSADRNKAIKSTAKNSGAYKTNKLNEGKFCNHCSKYFPDDDALIKHLYENITASKAKSNLTKSDNSLEPKPDPDTNFKIKPPQNMIFLGESQPICKFKCKLCGMILSNYSHSRKHRKIEHPSFKGQNLFTKIKSKTKPSLPISSKKLKMHPSTSESHTVNPKTVSKLSKHKSPTQGLSSHALVPIGALFKCHKCDVHFTTFTSVMQHSRKCPKSPGEWTCEICRLQFRSWARVMHNLQHKYATKFNVYVCNESARRVYNECPDCHIYFNEYFFFIHTSSGETCDRKSIHCKLCKIDISPVCFSAHKDTHDRIELSQDNIILIKFTKTSDVKVATGASKRQSDLKESETLPKKAKPAIDPSDSGVTSAASELFVYYCRTCDTFMFSSHNRQFHLEGKCEGSKSMKVVCKFCGLTCFSSHVTKKVCKAFHSILSMVFRDVQDDNLIAPAIPEYFRCPTCKVHFCDRNTVQLHDCDDKHKTCSYCKKKYSDLAHKLHIKFHEYQLQFEKLKKPSTSDLALRPTHKVPKAYNQKPDSPMSEILKKYEELSGTWNILYKCETCDIVCDDYDKVVEHCQNHFNNMENYDVFIQKCQTCDLKFDSRCYERHRALHEQNRKIGRNSFQLLKYHHNKLYHQYWNRNLFKNLTQSQTIQIISRSIYKYASAKSLKMRVVREGNPDAVMYKCGKCENVVHPSCIASHNRSLSCNKNNQSVRCNICMVPVATVPTKIDHEKMHRFGNNFKIIYFNEEGDEEFNEKLIERYQQHIKNQKKNLPSLHFYKCEKCNFGCATERGKRKHLCLKAKTEMCRKCKLLINIRLLGKHKKLHDLFPTKSIKVTTFKPLGAKGAESLKQVIVNLYECDCGLHFTTMKAVEKHSKVCKTNEDIAEEKCSKCGLLFDTAQLVTHLCQHHSSDRDKTIKFKITKVNSDDTINTPDFKSNMTRPLNNTRYPLYKCRRCDVHCLTSNSLLKHSKTNHSHKMKITPCPHCKLKFLPQSRLKHINFHHNKLRLKRKDFDIKTIPVTSNKDTVYAVPKFEQKAQVKADLQVYTNVLYKCKACKHHFLTLHSLLSHKSRPSCLSNCVAGRKCPICHYKMTIRSLIRHKYVHHQVMKLKREDFEIKCSKPVQYSENSDDKEVEERNTDNVKTDVPKRAVAKKSTAKSSYPNKIIYERDESSQSSSAETDRNEVSKIRSYARKSTAENTFIKEDDSKEIEFSLPETDIDFNTHKASKEVEKQGKQTYKFFNVIFKCGICGSHCLSEKHIGAHIQNMHLKHETQGGETETCFCGITFLKTIISRHENLHHEAQNLKSSDMYVITVNVNNNIIGHNHLFRCAVCQNYYVRIKSVEEHMNEVEHIRVKSGCPQCDLRIHSKWISIHISQHHEAQNLSLDDYVVMETVGQDQLKIVNINDEPGDKSDKTCDKSASTANNYAHDGKLNICTRNKFSDIGKETSVTCDVTDDSKTNVSSISLKHNSISIKKHISLLAKTSISKAADKYLDYLKKYKTLYGVDISNYELEDEKILYQCKYCCVSFMHKTSLRTHYGRSRLAQYHCSPTGINCYICNLSISRTIFRAHVEIHHKNLKLSRKDFYFVQSTKDNTKTDNEHKEPGSTFRDKNDDEYEVTNKTSNSEPKLVSNKTEDFVLFKCHKCSINFLSSSTRDRHAVTCVNQIQNRVKCQFCNKLFSKVSRTKHLKLHHNVDISDITDVSQDGSEDVSVVSQDDVMVVENYHTSSIKPDSVSNVDAKKDYLLFKCHRCSLSFLNKKTLSYHMCSDYKKKYKCRFCDNLFSKVSFCKHLIYHHNQKYKDLSYEDDISLDDSQDTSAVTQNDDMDVENYEKQDSDSYISKVNEHILFHCDKCSLNFVTKKAHSRHSCESDRIKYKCDICEKLFTKISLTKHLKLHHKQNNDKGNLSLDKDATVDSQTDNSFGSKDNVSQKRQILKRQNIDEDEPNQISDKISTLNADLYSNKLFKCAECALHFVTAENWVWHTQKAKHDAQRAHCTFCGLAFPVQTLPTHVFVHHEKLKLKLEHFLIDTKVIDVVEIDDSGNESEEKPSTSTKKIRLDHKKLNTTPKLSNANSNASAKSKNINDVYQDVELIDTTVKGDADKNDNTERKSHLLSSPNSTGTGNRTPQNTNIIKLYKCADCNVCFLNQPVCYKHVMKHTPLDPIDYIECKMCGYQFLVKTSLPKHLEIHQQRTFKPENILIEEYDPNTFCHGSPKINIYFGSDKVQSKLITTTSQPKADIVSSADNKNVEIIDLENNCENSSIDSSRNTEISKEMVLDEINVESKLKTPISKSNTDVVSPVDKDVPSDEDVEIIHDKDKNTSEESSQNTETSKEMLINNKDEKSKLMTLFCESNDDVVSPADKVVSSNNDLEIIELENYDENISIDSNSKNTKSCKEMLINDMDVESTITTLVFED